MEEPRPWKRPREDSSQPAAPLLSTLSWQAPLGSVAEAYGLQRVWTEAELGGPACAGSQAGPQGVPLRLPSLVDSFPPLPVEDEEVKADTQLEECLQRLRGDFAPLPALPRTGSTNWAELARSSRGPGAPPAAQPEPRPALRAWPLAPETEDEEGQHSQLVAPHGPNGPALPSPPPLVLRRVEAADLEAAALGTAIRGSLGAELFREPQPRWGALAETRRDASLALAAGVADGGFGGAMDLLRRFDGLQDTGSPAGGARSVVPLPLAKRSPDVDSLPGSPPAHGAAGAAAHSTPPAAAQGSPLDEVEETDHSTLRPPSEQPLPQLHPSAPAFFDAVEAWMPEPPAPAPDAGERRLQCVPAPPTVLLTAAALLQEARGDVADLQPAPLVARGVSPPPVAAPTGIQQLAPVPAEPASAGGFRTAGGRPLVASAAALERNRGFFEDFSPVLGGAGGGGFMTAAGRAVPPPSDAARARAVATMAEPSTGVFAAPAGGGFMTGAGRAVAPTSAAAQARAAGLMAGAGEDFEPPARAPLHPVRQQQPRPPGGFSSFLSPPAAHGAAGRSRPGCAPFIPPARAPLVTPSPRHGGPRAAPPTTGGRGAFTPGVTPRGGGSGGLLPARSTSVPTPQLHSLFAELAGQRQPLQSFFGGIGPFQTCCPPGLRPSSFPLTLRPVTSSVRSENASNIALSFSEVTGPMNAELAHVLLHHQRANPSLATEAWVRNAWRWIVWKLAATERAFLESGGFSDGHPSRLPLRSDRAFDQLKLRYEREHGRAQYPLLRRIFEGDSPPSSAMCLMISAVGPPQPPSGAVQIELCDGWYPIRAQLDSVLSSAVVAGRLRVGDKLYVAGCLKLGGEHPAPPLEAYSSLQLALACNGVRRAPWHARLGALPPPSSSHPLRMLPLCWVRQGGGIVPALALTVARVFPLVHLETLNTRSGDGVVKTMRSNAAEVRYAHDWYARRQVVSEEVSQAFLRKGDRDPSTLEGKVREALEAEGLYERRPTPLLKLLVTGFCGSEREWGGEALVTIFGPDDGAMQALREGASFVVCGLGTELRRSEDAAAPAAILPRGTGPRGGLLELSGRGARWLQAGPTLPRGRQPDASPMSGLYSHFKPCEILQLHQLLPQSMVGAAAGDAAAADALNPPAELRLRDFFDCCVVLVHATAVWGEGQGRRRRQHAFFVDASLAERIGEGGASECPLLALTLCSFHEGGFLPLNPIDPPSSPFGDPPDESYPFPVMSLRHITWSGVAPHRLLTAEAGEMAECLLAPNSSVQPRRPGFVAQLAAVAAAQRAWAALPGSIGLLHLLRQRARLLTATPLALTELSERIPQSPRPPLQIEHLSLSPSCWRGVLDGCDALERSHQMAAAEAPGAEAIAAPPQMTGQPHEPLGAVAAATLLLAGGDTQLINSR